MNRGISNRFILLLFTLAMASLFMLNACDETFEPLQENDRYFFSIYGFLDASADTQWVRIIPLREGLNQLPELDGTVTLENLETGETSVMNDSLFQYQGGNQAWNFWSTMNLSPEGTYRLSAVNGEGQESSVVVEMPPDFPTPKVFENTNTQFGVDTVLIEGVENLADVRTIWSVSDNFSPTNRVFNYPHLQDTVDTNPGFHELEINTMRDIERIARIYHPDFDEAITFFTPQRAQVWVASAGPGWLFFPEIDENIVTLADGISNVENGTGYLIGIVSKTVPLESCFDEDDEVIACEEEIPLWSSPIQ